MSRLRRSSAVFLTLVFASALGCERPAAPAPVVDAPPPAAEPAVIDPVHLGDEKLRSPLLESLRQHVEDSENDETRGVTQPLTSQLAAADKIYSNAREQNRAAIRQANRQVRIGAAQQSPNFVLIAVNRLGVGDLGCYGQSRWQTPALDNLSETGLRFAQFYGGLEPDESLAALLMASMSPNLNPARANTTLPKVLWNAGYKTGLIGEWSDAGRPSDHGYEDSSGWNSVVGEFPDWILLNGQQVGLENGSNREQRFSKVDVLVNEVRSFLRDARGRPNPFFLHVSLRPFVADPIRTASAGDYESRVREVDSISGQIVDSLEEFGLANRTCVIFTALAGPRADWHELVREIMSTVDFSHDSTGLREGNLRVPLLVRWPGKIPPGVVTDAMAGVWDLSPTLAQLAYVSRPIGRVDGRTLVEVWLRQQSLAERRIVWKSVSSEVIAARKANWKAVREAGRIRLFNLDDDPNERRDISAEHPDVVRELMQP